MIFVTVGTHEDGFPRLLAEMNRIAPRLAEPVVAQTGYARDPLPNLQVEGMIPFDRVQALMRDARIIVTHGGPASIMQALAYGKVPVVVPRQSAHGEHVDDHQVRFAQRIADRVIVVLDITTLEEVLRDHPRLAADRGARADGPANARRFAARFDALCEELLLTAPTGGRSSGMLRWRR